MNKKLQKFLLAYLRRFPIDIGKARIAKYVSFEELPKMQQYSNRAGVVMNLNLHEHSHKNIFLYDYYERNTFFNLKKLIAPHFTCIDVGANVGFYTLNLANLLTSGTIHAFEPNPVIYEELSKNVTLNGFTNVHLNNCGLSNKVGETTFFVPKTHHGAGSLYGRVSEKIDEIKIKLTTLDEYCKKNEIHHIDLLKVDIEGHELYFLEGAQKIIHKSPEMILIMEMAEDNFQRAGYSSRDVFDYLKKLKFKAHLPKGFPFWLKPIQSVPDGYKDNIIFLKGY